MSKGKVRKSQKKRGRKSRSKGGKRMPKQQIATVKQTLSFKPGTQRFNELYTIYNAALSNSTRAMKVAEAYQEYRISKVVIRWKPQQDTFGGTNGSVPYLHYVVDKLGTFQNGTGLNFRSLRETGCKVIRFDDKSVTLTVKPAVLSAVTTNTYNANPNLQFTAMRVSPWLNTNNTPLQQSGPWTPNSVDHGGIIYGVEQDHVSTSGLNQYDVDIEVYYQFRKPRAMTQGPVIPILAMDLDEGGPHIQL